MRAFKFLSSLLVFAIIQIGAFAQQITSDSKSMSDSILVLNDSINHYDSLMWSSLDSSSYYEKVKDAKMAFVKFYNYLIYRDFSSKYKDKKKKYEAYTDYNLAKAEKEHLIRQKEKEIIAFQASRNRLIIYSFVALIIVLAIIVFLVIQINRFKSNRRLIEISERNLRQQLNPEFILNVLNSIQYSLYSEDKNTSHKTLARFAKFMRLVLENSQHKLIALQQEIEAINHYLELETLRYKKNFNYQLQVKNNLDTYELKVPPLLIQSLIEIIINEIDVGEGTENVLKVNFELREKKIKVIIGYVFNSCERLDIGIEKITNSNLYKERVNLLRTIYKDINISDFTIVKNNSKSEFVIIVAMPLIYQ